MKPSSRIALTLLSLLFLSLIVGCQRKEKPAAVQQSETIYDETADPRQDIQTAVQKAQKEGKHVLLMFGGNWCPWCHRLHHVFETDKTVREFLHVNYVRLLVNVSADRDKRDTALNEAYGNPFQHGFPVLVVLDGQGNRLWIQETGSLEKIVQEGEEKGHDPQKVLAFLKEWAPSGS